MRWQYSILLSVIPVLFTYPSAVNAQSCHAGGGSESSQTTASENKKEELPSRQTLQTICPVMGNTVDRTISATWDGNEHFTSKRVYFCCGNCVKKFNKHPERYVKKLIKMGQFVENVFDKNEEKTR